MLLSLLFATWCLNTGWKGAGGLKIQLMHTHKFFGQVTVVEYVDEGGEYHVEIYSRRGLLCRVR